MAEKQRSRKSKEHEGDKKIIFNNDLDSASSSGGEQGDQSQKSTGTPGSAEPSSTYGNTPMDFVCIYTDGTPENSTKIKNDGEVQRNTMSETSGDGNDSQKSTGTPGSAEPSTNYGNTPMDFVYISTDGTPENSTKLKNDGAVQRNTMSETSGDGNDSQKSTGTPGTAEPSSNYGNTPMDFVCISTYGTHENSTKLKNDGAVQRNTMSETSGDGNDSQKSTGTPGSAEPSSNYGKTPMDFVCISTDGTPENSTKIENDGAVQRNTMSETSGDGNDSTSDKYGQERDELIKNIHSLKNLLTTTELEETGMPRNFVESGMMDNDLKMVVSCVQNVIHKYRQEKHQWHSDKRELDEKVLAGEKTIDSMISQVEQKENENDQYKERVAHFIEEMGKQTEQINQQSQELQQKNKEIEKLTEKCQKHEDDIKEKTQHIKGYEDEIDKQKRTINKKENKLKQTEDDKRKLENKLKQTEDDKRKLDNKLKQTEDDKRKLTRDIESRQKQIQQQTLKLNQNTESIRNQASQINQQNDYLAQQYQQLTEQYQQIQQQEYQIQYRDGKLEEMGKKIQVLDHEKSELTLRLSKLAGAQLTRGNPNIADLSDMNRPTKLAEKYSELYDNEWTDAFEELTEKEHTDEEKTVKDMLDILKTVYTECLQATRPYREIIQNLKMVTVKVSTASMKQETCADTDGNTQDQSTQTDEVEQALNEGSSCQEKPPYDETDDSSHEPMDTGESEAVDKKDGVEQSGRRDLPQNQENLTFDSMDGVEYSGRRDLTQNQENLTFDNMDGGDDSGHNLDENVNADNGDQQQRDSNSQQGRSGSFTTQSGPEVEQAKELTATDKKDGGDDSGHNLDENVNADNGDQQQRDSNSQQRRSGSFTAQSGPEVEQVNELTVTDEKDGGDDSGHNLDENVNADNGDQQQRDSNSQQRRSGSFTAQSGPEVEQAKELTSTDEKNSEKVGVKLPEGFETNVDTGEVTAEVKVKVEFTAEQLKTVSDMKKLCASQLEKEKHISKIIAQKIAIERNIDINDHEKLMAFIARCAHLCWYMLIQEPPVVIGFVEPTEDTGFDKDVYKAYTKVGKYLDFVVWPPLYLHQGGPMLCKGTAQGKKKI